MIQEHILTIEKSMKQITELSKKPNENYNQIVRWVLNKEKHADELVHTVTQYFLAQRIKPVDEDDSKPFRDYLFKVSNLHKMIVYAMKAKQTTDQANVDKLRSLLQDFRKVYFGKEKTMQSE
jgi:nickel superoxide dismutase